MNALPLVFSGQRCPNILFSRLRPGAKIPPHNGMINTRLIGHLPLIIPEDCGFRVGNSTRTWNVGEAFLFDDTIEHEAWNNLAKIALFLSSRFGVPSSPKQVKAFDTHAHAAIATDWVEANELSTYFVRSSAQSRWHSELNRESPCRLLPLRNRFT